MDVTRRRAMGMGAMGLTAIPMAVSAPTLAASSDKGVPILRGKPVLVFDVNETLLDIDVLNPIFDRIFGVPGRMREWFAQLILYSEAITLGRTLRAVRCFGREASSACWVPFTAWPSAMSI